MKSDNGKKQTILFLIKLILLATITATYGIIWYRFYADELYRPFYFYGNLVVIFVFMITYAGFSKLYGVFELRLSRTSELIYSNIISILITSFVNYCIIILIDRRIPKLTPFLIFMGIAILITIPWSVLANRLTNRVISIQRILIIYDNEAARRNGEYILKNITWRYSLLDQLYVSEDIEDTIEKIQSYDCDGVMLCGIHSSPRNTILKYCINHNLRVYLRPNIGDFIVNSAEDIQLANLPVLLCQRAAVPTTYKIGKRLMDILLAILGLIVFSPFMIVTAIAIKAYDKGPILYKQVRLTKDGREFNVYKFRSMRVDAEKDGVARLASKGDDRITPVGKIIRAVRIDEMPQIFCILKGDMSIVGPRPERPEIARDYEKEMPEFALRLQVKAGLTGYAQVFGKYNTEPYDKLQMDLMYIARQSFVTDLKIILATIKILFLPESTEGISAGQTTAMTQGIVDYDKVDTIYSDGEENEEKTVQNS